MLINSFVCRTIVLVHWTRPRPKYIHLSEHGSAFSLFPTLGLLFRYLGHGYRLVSLWSATLVWWYHVCITGRRQQRVVCLWGVKCHMVGTILYPWSPGYTRVIGEGQNWHQCFLLATFYINEKQLYLFVFCCSAVATIQNLQDFRPFFLLFVDRSIWQGKLIKEDNSSQFWMQNSHFLLCKHVAVKFNSVPLKSYKSWAVRLAVI